LLPHPEIKNPEWKHSGSLEPMTVGTQGFDPVHVAEQVVMIEAFEHQLTFHLADGTMTPVGLTSEGRLA